MGVGATTRVGRIHQTTAALELRVKGASLEEIANQLGVSRATAVRRLRGALDLLGEESADQIRRTIESRYDDLLGRLYRLLGQELRVADEVRVINAILTLESGRTRLLGVAVPSTVVIAYEQEQAGLLPPNWQGSNGHSGGALLQHKPARAF